MSFGDWTCARPAALWLLALPVLLVLLARAFARERPENTGTVDIWRRVASSRPSSGARARRRVPPYVFALASALALAALALAAPHPRHATDAGPLEVIVDRSPSMYLPVDGSRASGGGAVSSTVSRTRLEAALEAARSELARHDPSRVTWNDPRAALTGVAGERTRSAGVHGATPPTTWTNSPRVPRPEVDFVAHDRAGVLWITDRAPAESPRLAGISASGGAAVPGPVAVRGDALVDWDGARLVERPASAPRGRVHLDAALPKPVASVVRIWAEARRLEIGDDDRMHRALDVIVATSSSSPAASAPTTHSVSVARDGWSATIEAIGRAPASDDDGALELWIVDPSTGEPLVSFGPGRVLVAAREMSEPGGDPAAFPVSWSRLLGACALPPPECVAATERAAAGAPVWIAPRAADSRGEDSSSVPAILGFAACAAALLAGLLWSGVLSTSSAISRASATGSSLGDDAG